MNTEELNPQHPVTAGVHDQWHKLCALLLDKFSPGQEVIITVSEVHAWAGKPPSAIVVHDRRDGLHLSIVPMAEAEMLAKKHGGFSDGN